MTYDEVELQFLTQIEHDLIYIANDGIYSCRCNCGQCPLNGKIPRWCRHDAAYRNALMHLCITKYPELFV